jgi:hypothetical protein
VLVGLGGGAGAANAAGCSTLVVTQPGSAGGSGGRGTAASTSGSARASSSSGSGGASAASSSSGSGGSSTAGTGGFGGSSSAGTGGGSGGSSSAGSSASSSGAPVDAGAPVSALRFEQCTGSSCAPGTSVIFTGGFDLTALEATPVPSFEGTWCQSSFSAGSCVVAGCVPDSFIVGESAGTITISGGAIPAGAMAMGAGLFGYDYEAATALFAPGQTLSVSATGDMVPAFGPEEVTVAPEVTLTTPVLTGGNPTVSTSSDLAVTWTGGQSGAVMTFEGGASNGVAPYFFTCSWDASLGQGTVPKVVLSSFSGLPNGYVAFGQSATVTFTAGAYSIPESAGMYATASVTYQ